MWFELLPRLPATHSSDAPAANAGDDGSKKKAKYPPSQVQALRKVAALVAEAPAGAIPTELSPDTRLVELLQAHPTSAVEGEAAAALNRVLASFSVIRLDGGQAPSLTAVARRARQLADTVSRVCGDTPAAPAASALVDGAWATVAVPQKQAVLSAATDGGVSHACASAWLSLRTRALDKAREALDALPAGATATNAVAAVTMLEYHVLHARRAAQSGRTAALDAAQRLTTVVVRRNRTPPLRLSYAEVQLRMLVAAAAAYRMKRQTAKALQVLQRAVRLATQGGTCAACVLATSSRQGVGDAAGAGAGVGAGAGAGAGANAGAAVHTDAWCPVVAAMVGIGECHATLGDWPAATAALADAVSACQGMVEQGLGLHARASAAWASYKATTPGTQEAAAAVEVLRAVCEAEAIDSLQQSEAAASRWVVGVAALGSGSATHLLRYGQMLWTSGRLSKDSALQASSQQCVACQRCQRGAVATTA